MAGTTLDGRYRLIGLIGRGGMGEVYKAEDLKLNQAVALKFLPEDFAKDKTALERFYAEVRTARQVSHPNVCRVFDIGEVEGSHFLSMEFIDGDDLSSLLRRIGRLPPDKAVEIARQLCAGLHAVHQAGVLHRDLKPANVIIDGRGRARITDFGIAGLAEELKDGAGLAGTPAYMSPEQITGGELTTKSDIYSLGLVLYEIFTGKQAFEADTLQELIRKHRTATPTNPSELIKDFDPLVEQVISRCLEKDPRERPASALQVAMMLPGGNHLEAVIAAGETPSPEMVAAAPKKGALRPVVAISLLVGAILLLGMVMFLSKQVAMHRQVPLEKSPEVLAERSREIAGRFGYPASDSYYGFVRGDDYVRYIRDNDKSPARWQRLAAGQPAVFQFWYRQSPHPLVPFSGDVVQANDPPQTVSGMAQLRLDTRGRLIFFEGVPPQTDAAANATKDFVWTSVFKEAGFDLNNFKEAESEWTPSQPYDERRAFTGRYPEQSDIPIRVEAAAYRGRLVNFQIVEPWDTPGETWFYQGGLGRGASSIILIFIFFTVLVISAWLAVRNVRVGRSDMRGAFRLGVFLFALRMLGWAFSTHHVASPDEARLLITGLEVSLFWSCFAGMMYLAFEPYLRRHMPERVISWNRLLAGDLRDPLVGRDILIGAFASMVLMALGSLRHFIPVWLGEPPVVPTVMSNPGGMALMGIRGFPFLFLGQIGSSLVQAFMISFLILFFTLLLRRKWLGSAAAWLLIFAFAISNDRFGSGVPLSGIALAIISPTVLVFIASRFGVLAVMSMLVFYHLSVIYPITTELTAWYAGDFVLCVGFLLALAIYGFYTSLAGQPLLKGGLLED